MDSPSIVRSDMKTCQFCKQTKPREQFANTRTCWSCAETPTCNICKRKLPWAEFTQGGGRRCKSCRKQIAQERYQEQRDSILKTSKAWKTANAAKYRSQQRAYRNQQREEIAQQVFSHYGPCSCCGEAEIKFLTVEHMNGNGAQHRRMIGKTDMWLWLYHNGFPKGYTLLCFNCNAGAFRNGGICPHKTRLASTMP